MNLQDGAFLAMFYEKRDHEHGLLVLRMVLFYFYFFAFKSFLLFCSIFFHLFLLVGG